MCSANVPGGGNCNGADVSIKDEGDSLVLDNRIVAIRINKIRLGSRGPCAETRVASPAGMLKKGANAVAISQGLAKGMAGRTQ